MCRLPENHTIGSGELHLLDDADERVASDEMSRMLLDILLHREPPVGESAKASAVRAELLNQVNEIQAVGGIVDIPFELLGGGESGDKPL